MRGVCEHVLARHDELGARRHGVDLRAAGQFELIHGVERLLDGRPAGQQAVVAHDHGVVRPQIRDQPRALVEIDLVALLLDERVIRASLSHAMNDYIPAIELLRRGKVDFESLITDRVPLQGAVDRGFEPLAADPESHLKVLIDCRQ